MSLTLRIPLCPWCDGEMRWLLDEDNLDTHEDVCRHCNNKVIIKGEAILVITAERWEHPKPKLSVMNGGKGNGN